MIDILIILGCVSLNFWLFDLVTKRDMKIAELQAEEVLLRLSKDDLKQVSDVRQFKL